MTFEPRAYAASAITLLYLVGSRPPPAARPCWSGTTRRPELASTCSKPPETACCPGSPGLRFPTAAVAVLEFYRDWAGLALAQARLLAYTSPRREWRGLVPALAVPE